MPRFNYTPLPPTHHHGTPRPISPASAANKLSSYIARAEDPENPETYLHPDCQFTSEGPALEGRTTGRVLHQLNRLAAGLRGERIGVDVEGLFGGLLSGPEWERGGGVGFGTEIMGNVGESLPRGDDSRLDGIIAAANVEKEDVAGEDEEEDDVAPRHMLDVEGRGDGMFSMASRPRQRRQQPAGGDEEPKSFNQQMMEQGDNGNVVGEVGLRNNSISAKGYRNTRLQENLQLVNGYHHDTPEKSRKRKRQSDDVNGEELSAKSPKTAKDKEARKEAKKERKKQEKRDKQTQHEREINRADSDDPIDNAPSTMPDVPAMNRIANGKEKGDEESSDRGLVNGDTPQKHRSDPANGEERRSKKREKSKHRAKSPVDVTITMGEASLEKQTVKSKKSQYREKSSRGVPDHIDQASPEKKAKKSKTSERREKSPKGVLDDLETDAPRKEEKHKKRKRHHSVEEIGEDNGESQPREDRRGDDTPQRESKPKKHASKAGRDVDKDEEKEQRRRRRKEEKVEKRRREEKEERRRECERRRSRG